MVSFGLYLQVSQSAKTVGVGVPVKCSRFLALSLPSDIKEEHIALVDSPRYCQGEKVIFVSSGNQTVLLQAHYWGCFSRTPIGFFPKLGL